MLNQTFQYNQITDTSDGSKNTYTSSGMINVVDAAWSPIANADTQTIVTLTGMPLGAMIWNTDTNMPLMYNGQQWLTITIS